MHFRTCMSADRETVLGAEGHFSARRQLKPLRRGRFSPQRAVRPRSSRTYAWDSSNLLRAIHKLDSANKVVSCAVFFLSPR